MLKENKQYEWTNNKGLFRLNLVSNYLEPIHNKYINNNLESNDYEEDKEYIKKLLLSMSKFYINYNNKNKNNSFNMDFLQFYSLTVAYYAVVCFYLSEFDNSIKLSVAAYETCPKPEKNLIILLDEIIAKSNSKLGVTFHLSLINIFKENKYNDFEDCVVQAQKLAENFMK
ncbi:MAG: hypothetical protein K0Q97_2406 [Bacillota bacterium]|jgi:hypothetical protein|nr:hypothetical protein [Bacillota bacterium]